jgi:hypothetical protein
MQLPEPDLLEAARGLVRRAGKAQPRSLARLAGGNNNRIYRVELDAGAPLILKRYFQDPRDQRDRLSAEWDFLQLVWGRGIRATPEPLGHEPASNTALYSFVPGSRIAANAVTEDHVATAADFLLAVNSPRTSLALSPASEACFSFAQHLETVNRRVERLAHLAPDVPLRTDAERFVSDRLRPAWRVIEQRITSAVRDARFGLEREIDQSECILSPSDFGFHNALEDESGRLAFVDFEYAGRDDVAKLVCDYFCQPKIPVRMCHFEPFLARLTDGLGFGATMRERCCLLLDAYRVKWTCIMLNEFLTVGAARRAFAHGANRDDRCRAQLMKARDMLSETGL